VDNRTAVRRGSRPSASELQLLLSALESEDLRRKLAEMLEAEISQLARLLGNRVIDPARPSDRTTPEQAVAIAKAMKAVLTGVRRSRGVHDRYC
jgi:hypothetical protein